jgi:hypothetical protein
MNYFFNISPQGIHTCLMEACTSYIPRLNIAHSFLFSTMLADVILPASGDTHLSQSIQRGSSRIYIRPTTFNGQNFFTEKIVKTLEALTGRTDLQYLTMLPLKGLIDPKNVFRSHRAWCPYCMENWRINSMVIYEALIWLIRPIKVCPVHMIPLQSICPSCGQSIAIIDRATRPGYCSKCGSWLSKNTLSLNSSSLVRLSQFDRWAATNVGTLIAAYGALPNVLSRSSLSCEIAQYIDICFGGSASSFAKALGIPRATVKRWRTGAAFPSLKHLLAISFITQTPLLELITQGIAKKSDWKQKVSLNVTLPLFPATKIIRKGFDFNRVKLTLQSVLRNSADPTLTMSKVALKTGYTKKTLYKHFPVLCRSIAAKAASYRKERKHNRLMQESLFVAKAAEQLHLAGLYPGYDAIERASSKKGILRGKEARSVWRAKLSDLGLRDSTSFNTY